MIDELVDCEKCPIKSYCEKVKTDLIEKKVEEVDLSNIEQSESRYRRELYKYMFDSPVNGGRKPCPLLKAEDVESCLSREIEKAEKSVAWTFAEERVNERDVVNDPELEKTVVEESEVPPEAREEENPIKTAGLSVEDVIISKGLVQLVCKILTDHPGKTKADLWNWGFFFRDVEDEDRKIIIEFETDKGEYHRKKKSEMPGEPSWKKMTH